jgi:oxidase EvaA
MIDQPELGWLGFVVRKAGDGVEWLVQAKTEPGNVRGTQLAPTLQATRSNYTQVHGGQPSRFLDLFRAGGAVISDGPHSEQGSAFLWKFNRNTTIGLPSGHEVAMRDHRWTWCDARRLRDCLGRSYTVNTDARSVIATSPWALLADGGTLFTAEPLVRSYRGSGQLVDSLLQRVAGTGPPRSWWSWAPLDARSGFRLGRGAIYDADDREVVVFREVTTADREVSQWCQPFLTQTRPGPETLLVRILDGAAEVFIRLEHELGLGNRQEFGPSAMGSEHMPPYVTQLVESPESVELIRIDQSDEGGRFMQAQGSYRIVLTHEDSDRRRRHPFGQWVPLWALEKLVRHPGATTNELRTLTSLLLSSELDRALSAAMTSA